MKITIEDIINLRPRVDELEDVYAIKTKDGVCYLEIYENSDFGLEYGLFDELFCDIDGGVIDEYDAETEVDVAQVVFDLLKEMNIDAIAIKKLSHEEDDEENVDAFHERVEEAWNERVNALKSESAKEREGA